MILEELVTSSEQLQSNLVSFKTKLVEFLEKTQLELNLEEENISEIAETFIASIHQKKKYKNYLLYKNNKLISKMVLIEGLNELYNNADKQTKNVIWFYLQLFYVLILTKTKHPETKKFIKSMLALIELNEVDNEESSEDESFEKINSFITNMAGSITNENGELNMNNLAQTSKSPT